MATFTVFYANKLYGEYEDPRDLTEAPDGAYLRDYYGWSLRKGWVWYPTLQSELPPEMQAIALLYFN